MINESNALLARRYAQAFFNVYASDITADHCRLMKKAATTLRIDGAWSTFFEFTTSASDKQEQMLNVLITHLSLPKILLNLCQLLHGHKRMTLLPDVLDAVVGLFLKKNNLIEFTIASFPQLTDAQVHTFVDFLHHKTGKNVQYECKLDNQLIAGVRARSELFLWEYSIAKKLREAQQTALNGNKL